MANSDLIGYPARNAAAQEYVNNKFNSVTGGNGGYNKLYEPVFDRADMLNTWNAAVEWTLKQVHRMQYGDVPGLNC